MPRLRTALALIALIAFGGDSRANDWPHWRGPDFNGISKETGWSSEWPKAGPPIAWKATVGTGFASVSVVAERLFTMGNNGEQDAVYCLDAATGREVWKHSYDADLGEKFFEGGPTATPTVDGDAVFTLSRWGDLFCFEAATGKVRWSKNVQRETGVRIPSWGFAGSPLVWRDKLVVNVGDAGMALSKRTGEIVWKSENKDAGYSTPLPYQRGNTSSVILGSGKSYVAVDVASGRELWRFPWLTQFGVNAADPLLDGEFALISSGYGKGAALLSLAGEQPKVVWQNKTLRNQINSSVLIRGFVFGIDGDATGSTALKCVEFQTGNVRWTESSLSVGALMAADGKLILLSDRGELVVADASPDGFRPRARSQVLGGKCWTVPVVANGRIYCRNAAGDLVCVDVRPAK